YWAYAWAGGTVLARYILDRPQTVAGRRVLDLGAGSGLVGIAAAKAGARAVIAAEIDRNGIVALGLNAAAN
ncbi:methyltransferase, partial [Mesorhizobium sp.]